MPIYEYRCADCRKVFSFLVGVVADNGKPACPRCGGKKLTKLISRIARIRSQDALIEELADPSRMGDMEDPRAMAQWAKKMGKALGDETGEGLGDDFEAMLDDPEGEKSGAEDIDEE